MEQTQRSPIKQEHKDFLKTKYLGDYVCAYFRKDKEEYLSMIEQELVNIYGSHKELTLENIIPVVNHTMQRELNRLFEENVKGIMDSLTRYFRPKVRRDIVDELVQQVLLSIQEGINRYQYLGMKPIKSYARGIAHNLFCDFLRKVKKQPEEYKEILNGFQDHYRLTPEENLLLRENSKIVAQCIHDLSYELRIIILLITYFDLSLKEISQVLNIPYKTVQSRKNKAMEILIEVLSKKLGE